MYNKLHGQRLKTTEMINFFRILREILTQTFKKKIVISIGMANALIKVNKKGFISKKGLLKRFAYYLTPDGFGEKSRLVKEYLESSLDFF